jgi:hypothetical protein
VKATTRNNVKQAPMKKKQQLARAVAEAAPANLWNAGAEMMQRLMEAPLTLVSVTDTDTPGRFDGLDRRLDKVEALLEKLVRQKTVKDWYSTAEVAELLGKAESTVREWCRLGRVCAEKRRSGRGAFPAWVVSREELERYQREGLLPTRTPA